MKHTATGAGGWRRTAYASGRGPGDPVMGYGPSPAALMFVGEGPGREEDLQGIPFIGRSGELLWQWVWRLLHLNRDDVYTTNLVKVHLTDNRDPTPEEIDQWSGVLVEELRQVQPSRIVALGRFSARFLTGRDEDMLTMSTRSYPCIVPGPAEGIPVTVVVHPAAGLHVTDMLTHTYLGLEAVGQNPYTAKGVVPEYITTDTYTGLDWLKEGVAAQVRSAGGDWSMVSLGLDTEGTEDEPYSVQVCSDPRKVWVMRADKPYALSKLYAYLEELVEHCGVGAVQVICHFLSHDLRVLAKLGLNLRAITGLHLHDTMLDSYHLQRYPQGLKALSKQLLDLPMREYEDVVGPATEALRVVDGLNGLRKLIAATETHDCLVPRTSERINAKGELKVRPLKPVLVKCECPLCQGKASLNRAVKAWDGGKGSVNWENRWKSLPPEALAITGPLTEPHLRNVPLDEFLAYAALDPSATLQDHWELQPQLEDMGLQEVSELDHAVLPMVEQMVSHGMLVSLPRLDSLQSDLQDMVGVLRQSLVEAGCAAGMPADWNPDSGDQLEVLLVDRLHLPLVKLTKGKTRMSTDASVLEGLIHEHEIVPQIQDYREVAKLEGTYAAGIRSLTDWSEGTRRGLGGGIGVLHPDLRTTRVVSGRLAGFLLTFPRPKTYWGKRIRECFVADAPGSDEWVLVSHDLGQIEPRELAHASKDEDYIAVFNSGKDIYKGIAGEVLGKSPEAVADEERQVFKMVQLAWMYDVQAQGLLDQITGMGIHLTIEQVIGLLDGANKRFPGINKHRQRVLTQIRRDGFSRGPSGRIRRLPAVYLQGGGWPWDALRSEAERQGFNFTVQEGAQYVEKLLMRRHLEHYLPQFPKGTVHYLLQIHDDLLSRVHRSVLKQYDQSIQEALQDVHRALAYSVPLVTDAKVGQDWGNMHAYPEKGGG